MKQRQTLRVAFENAFRGIGNFFVRERNGRIQGVAAVAVTGAGVWLRIGASEWLAVLLCIALVIPLEMLNSALEKLCDRVQPDRDPVIGTIKDVAAGAVLVAALVSVVVAALIFIPLLRR